jgi:hypothetical protein
MKFHRWFTLGLLGLANVLSAAGLPEPQSPWAQTEFLDAGWLYLEQDSTNIPAAPAG